MFPHAPGHRAQRVLNMGSSGWRESKFRFSHWQRKHFTNGAFFWAPQSCVLSGRVFGDAVIQVNMPLCFMFWQQNGLGAAPILHRMSSPFCPLSAGMACLIAPVPVGTAPAFLPKWHAGICQMPAEGVRPSPLTLLELPGAIPGMHSDLSSHISSLDCSKVLSHSMAQFPCLK